MLCRGMLPARRSTPFMGHGAAAVHPSQYTHRSTSATPVQLTWKEGPPGRYHTPQEPCLGIMVQNSSCALKWATPEKTGRQAGR